MRALVGTTAVVVMCVLTAGCTHSDAPSSQGSPDAGASSPSVSGSPAEPVTLTFAVFGNRAEVGLYRRLADAYIAKHPNVTIRLRSARDDEQAETDLDREIDAGDPPDLFLTDHDAVPGLVAAGQVQPVDELLEKRGIQFGDSYERIGLEAFSANSALQCMPHDVSPIVVYYNKSLLHLRRLDQLGDPPTPQDGWTWDQFTHAAKMSSHGNVKGIYIAPTLDNLAALVRSGGSDIVDDVRTPTSLTLADGGTRSALEQILTLARDPLLTPTRAALTRHDAVARFENGKLAMMLGTRALTPQLRRAKGLRFDVMPLPRLSRPRTLSLMTGYCISAKSAHIGAAADFLAYAIGNEGAALTAEAGGIVPANLEAQHSPAFVQPGQQPKNVSVFTEGVHDSDSTPFVATWPGLVRATQPDIERMFYAPVIDLDKLLPSIDAQSQRILVPTLPSESPSPSAH
jgi:multiple sugar transport system substrate-binding protein